MSDAVIEGIPTGVADLTGWGAFVTLAMLVVMAVFRGWLRTGREVDAEKARADAWQQAWSIERDAGKLLTGQVAELMEYARTSAKIVEGIQLEHHASREGSGGRRVQET